MSCHVLLGGISGSKAGKRRKIGTALPKKKGMQKLSDCHSFFTKYRADAPTCTGTTTSHQPHWLTSLTKPIVVTWEMQRNALTKQKLEWFPHKKKKTPNLYYLKRKLSHSWGSKIYQANKCPNLPDRARTQFPKAERIPSSYTCFFLRKINRSCLDTKTFIYPIMYVLRHIPGTA